MACCRQSSPAHLPFYRPAHNRGKPGRRRGRRQMENKERTKALLPRGQKAGALLPPPVLASLSSPAPVPPQASGHLPRPSRLALASQGVPHLLGDPQKVIPLQATFFLSVNEEVGQLAECSPADPTPLTSAGVSLRPPHFFLPLGCRGSSWVPTSTHREDPRVPWGQARQTGSLCSQHLGAGCKHLPGMNEGLNQMEA